MHIDLNCDLGEGCALDGELMPLITSANVSCGWHAGDAGTASATLSGAVRNGVGVGAHPGFNDRANFGRREMARSEPEIFQDCVYQVGALPAPGACRHGGSLYQGPRRTLQHGMSRRRLCPAVDSRCGVSRPAVAGACQVPACKRCVRTAAAVCRRALPTGATTRMAHWCPAIYRTLLSIIPMKGAQQALRLMNEKGVETICVHGDNPQALSFVRALRDALERAGCEIRAFA